MDQFLERLVSPMSSFLVLSFSGRSLGTRRLTQSTYLPWLLRPTREGAQGGAPSAIQAGAGGLRT